jgi:hypothetical protein
MVTSLSSTAWYLHPAGPVGAELGTGEATAVGVRVEAAGWVGGRVAVMNTGAVGVVALPETEMQEFSIRLSTRAGIKNEAFRMAASEGGRF